VKLYYLLILLIGLVPVCKAQQATPDPSLIKSIYFGGGSYYISDRQVIELREWIESFPNIDGYTITVHSHTDNIGSAEYNQMLSEMRSYMSIEKLLELNIPRERITIQDFGQFNPIYDNSTFNGRLMNRRVDIILWPIEAL
jgi:outer membrane protein OmpA-like peptidoglycan-associated protein